MSNEINDQVDGLQGLLTPMLEASELTHYAAHAAAGQLFVNWRAALGDGADLRDLVGDVDDVIEVLRKFKADAMALAPESPAPGL